MNSLMAELWKATSAIMFSEAKNPAPGRRRPRKK
jgi:hypothetical protein